MRRLLLVSAVVAAVVGFTALRPDVAHAQDTAAVAVNTKDGSSIFRLAFAIKRAAGDVVDNANAAVSFASCNECQTIAISIQVVFVTGDPEVVSPQNIALAYNVLCTLCDTLASAYQWVLGTDGQVHFTAEGNQSLAQIRHELRELGRSGLSGPEIQARLDELMQRLARVLEHELVQAGRSGSAPPAATTQQTPTATTTTEPAETEPLPTTTATTPGTGTETTTPTTTTTTP
jgi:putative peptide zinc metalloprotease protein